MTYLGVSQMRTSNSLAARMTACAAREGAPGDPSMWVQANLWALVKDPEWATVWCAAKGAPDAGNMNADTGARTDVISDAMICDAVRALLPPEPVETPAGPAAEEQAT